MVMDVQKEEYAKLTEALAKMRDWLQHGQELREVLDELLNLAVQNQAGESNPACAKWSQAEGPSGPYELATADDNKGSNLVNELREHENKMTKGSFFVCLFSDGSRVGRKPSRMGK